MVLPKVGLERIHELLLTFFHHVLERCQLFGSPCKIHRAFGLESRLEVGEHR